jgi:hypothetical protein
MVYGRLPFGNHHTAESIIFLVERKQFRSDAGNPMPLPTDDLRPRLLKALKDLELSLGVRSISQTELAERLSHWLGRKVPQSSVSEWLNKKPPADVDVLWAFAGVCGVPPALLAFGLQAMEVPRNAEAGAPTQETPAHPPALPMPLDAFQPAPDPRAQASKRKKGSG